MSYILEFNRSALKEWRKLGANIREQFKKKLKQRLKYPEVPSAQLYGMPDCYKIKLRNAGYRLVYRVLKKEIIVLVVAVGKRERSLVYEKSKERLD